MGKPNFTTRSPIWAAPVVWQILFSLESIWFGISSILGQTFRTSTLFWLNESPFAYFMLGLGLFGLAVVFTRWHLGHLLFALNNVFLFAIIFVAYCQSIILVPTTGVYGVQLLGSMWLFIRLVVDNRIRVAIRGLLMLL